MATLVVSRENEPPAGTWVKDRYGATHQRNPKGGKGWGQPGCYYLGEWAAMWDGRGPLEVCGPWGAPLPPEPEPPTPSYRVTWTYVDQFGRDRRESSDHMGSRMEAVYFAADYLTEAVPDAWWIDEIRTVEYHEAKR